MDPALLVLLLVAIAMIVSGVIVGLTTPKKVPFSWERWWFISYAESVDTSDGRVVWTGTQITQLHPLRWIATYAPDKKREVILLSWRELTVEDVLVMREVSAGTYHTPDKFFSMKVITEQP